MRRPRNCNGTASQSNCRTNKDDFEGACILDRYFCRAENPKKGELEKYLPMIKREAYFGYNKFITSFKILGFEQDDVYSLALCYATSFLGLYSLEKCPAKMEKLVQRYQEKNKTDSLPTEADIFKKNRSDMETFLKQKIENLHLVAKKNRKKVFLSTEKVLFFKTKETKIANHQALFDNEELKGYNKITKREFQEAQKKAKTISFEFSFEGWTYFSIQQHIGGMVSLEAQLLENNEENTFFDKCGITESKEDILEMIDIFNKLSEKEKIEVLKNVVENSKDKEVVEVAKEYLEILK